MANVTVTRADIAEIKATQERILEAINGNGKPGIKTEIAILKTNTAVLQSDVAAIEAARAQEAKEREAELKARESERRAFNRSISLLVLGQAITLIVAIFVR